MTNKANTSDVLVLKRVFNASIERVFDAWTKPELLAKWFGPEGFSVTRSEMQLYVGGSYNIEICSPDGKQIRHFGNYLEISSPHKLVFTWMLADQACKGGKGLYADTLVTIELTSIEPTLIELATELTLTHERLPGKDAYDGHKFGWTSSLNALNTYLQ